MSVHIQCKSCKKKWHLKEKRTTNRVKCPICSQESCFFIEAENLTEAEAHLPPAMRIIKKIELSNTASKTAVAYGDTIELARERALKDVPKKANIHNEKTTPASNRQVQVHAFSESQVKPDSSCPSLVAGERIAGIELVERGRKGIFGLGRKPNTYEVRINKAACVSIEYALKARILFSLQRVPRTLDELQADLSELRVRFARVQKKPPARSPNSAVALITITGLFNIIEDWVSSELAFLLKETKRFLPDNTSIQELSLPKVEFPQTLSAADREMTEATRLLLSQCSQSLKLIDMLISVSGKS